MQYVQVQIILLLEEGMTFALMINVKQIFNIPIFQLLIQMGRNLSLQEDNIIF